MKSPELDSSITAVADTPVQISLNDLLITGNSSNVEEHVLRRLSTSNKSKHLIGDGFTETNNELEAISSNETITEANAMFLNDKDLDFPEGGKEAYLVLFGAFIGLIPNFGLLNAMGAIQTYVAENQLVSVQTSTVAWIFSILLFVNFLVSVFAGTFFDRNGCRIPMVLGTLLVTGGCMATANSTKVWHFILSFSIVVGVGNGIMSAPLLGCVAHFFSRKRGLMVSIAGCGGSIGGIVFPIMLRKLFQEVGFAWAIRIFGFIQLACYAISIALVHERLPLQQSSGTNLQKIASYFNAIDFKGLTDFKYLFTVIGCSLAEAAALTVSTYQISYARAQGCTLNDSYLMLSVSHATGIGGRWLSGYLADKLGRYNVMISTLIMSGAIIYITLLPFGSSVAAMYVFNALWGFSTGSIFPLLPVCCSQISRTDEFGRRYGTMYFIVAFITLVSIPIAGAIIGKEDTTGFRNYVIYSGILILVSGLFYYISRLFCVGSKIKVKF